jgi:ribosomal protein S27AE
MVPVPREYLAAVYGLLGGLMSDRRPGLSELTEEASCPHCGGSAFLGAPGGAYRCGECGLTFRQLASTGQVEVDHENGCWSERMIQRLHDELQDSTSARALTIIAGRAPGTVSSDELASLLSIDSNTLRAELGALSKACRRVFGRKVWPMSARQGWGEGSRMGYRMPELVAQWWLTATDSRGSLEAAVPRSS